jgi:hypothetical protein
MRVVELWGRIAPLPHAREQAEMDDQPRAETAEKEEK